MNQKQKMTRNVIKFLIIFFIALLSFNIISYLFTPGLKESMTEGDIQFLNDRIRKVDNKYSKQMFRMNEDKLQNDFSLVKGSDVKRDDIVMVMDPDLLGKRSYYEFTGIKLRKEDLRKEEKAPYTYEQFLSVCYMLGMTKLQLIDYIKNKNNDSKLSNDQKMLNLIEFFQKRNYKKITDLREFSMLYDHNILNNIISGKEKRTLKEIIDAKNAEYMARKNK